MKRAHRTLPRQFACSRPRRRTRQELEMYLKGLDRGRAQGEHVVEQWREQIADAARAIEGGRTAEYLAEMQERHVADDAWLLAEEAEDWLRDGGEA